MPVVTPQRVTRGLIRVLKKHHPLWMSLHFTHPDELTREVTEATARLADAGIPLGSQTVLLKGINDDAAVMTQLMHGLLKNRVKPYYLYQCDPIRGSAHFRTGVDKGLGDHPRPARPHHRLCHADLRDRCAGRRRQDPACARSGGGPRRRRSCCCAISKARSTAIPTRTARSALLRSMRIGVTYDLRSDYLALGYGEEETAEFDAEETIAAICAALAGLGHQPERIGGIRPLAAALVAGARWDAVFNICEGLKGVAREAQVPALLEAYDIPYVFSDPLTLALWPGQGDDQAGGARCRCAHRRFRRDRDSEADIAKVTLPFPAVPQAGLGRLGQGRGCALPRRHPRRAGTAWRATCSAGSASRCWWRNSCPAANSPSASPAPARGAAVLGVIEIVPTANYVGHGYGYREQGRLGGQARHRARG